MAQNHNDVVAVSACYSIAGSSFMYGWSQELTSYGCIEVSQNAVRPALTDTQRSCNAFHKIRATGTRRGGFVDQ